MGGPLAVKRLAAGARRGVHRLQSAVPVARRGALVLAYHLVDGGTDGPVDLPLATFEAHLDLLTTRARVVPLGEVDPSGPPDQVVLTFDDAYRNFHDVVWPRLRERGLPALLYVPVDFVDGGPCPIRGADLAPCSWEQLAEMVGEGLEIGSHTCTHPDLRTLSGAALDDELARSKAILEERLQTPVTSFCYPRGLHTREARERAGAHYRTAVVGGGRRYGPRTPSAAVPRVSLRREHGADALAAMLDRRVWLEEWLADAARQWRA